jgi:hypothetical protein
VRVTADGIGDSKVIRELLVAASKAAAAAVAVGDVARDPLPLSNPE